MLIKGGFNFAFDCNTFTPILLMMHVRPERAHDFVEPELFTLVPNIPCSTHRDAFGNICTRLIAPPGHTSIWNRFLISDPGLPEELPTGAYQHPVHELPEDTLQFLLGSRYCETQKLSDLAWALFGGYAEGWPRVQAIIQYAHDQLTFSYPHARPDRTAWDAHQERIGVCRDYTHLAISLLRCMNIPARYCTGYLGDIGVPRDPAPMDFSAWGEVFLSGKWWTVDARHNQPRTGRILMAYGRDAADVAISTAFGVATLSEFMVITEEVPLVEKALAIAAE